MPIENDDELREILTSSKIIACVGAPTRKPSYGIFAYLLEQGYEMIPVNPGASRSRDESRFPDLASIPQKVDVVQVFRKPEDVPAVVEHAIRIGAMVVWMQEDVINPEAALTAESAGLKVVMNRCMRKTHLRLVGGRARP
jgi:predicted CoA-binding protein